MHIVDGEDDDDDGGDDDDDDDFDDDDGEDDDKGNYVADKIILNASIIKGFLLE